jgi:hypothetical protein
VGEYLATELTLQYSSEKLHTNSDTTQSCLNTENTLSEKLLVIKASSQWLCHECVNANKETQDI